MHQYSNTGAVSFSFQAGGSTEDLIIVCSEPVKKLASKFAGAFDGKLEFDDLYGAGMLQVCEAVAAGRVLAIADPVNYLVAVARYGMCAEWQRVNGWSQTKSFDAYVSSELCAGNLYDFVAAPPAPETIDQAAIKRAQAKRAHALYGAIRRMPPKQRAVLRRRFGLPGYGMHSSRSIAHELRAPVRAVNQLQRRGLEYLRKDARLCSVVGVLEVKR